MEGSIASSTSDACPTNFTRDRDIAKFVTATIAKLYKDEQGATSIEYGLIASSIIVAIIVVIFALGGDIQNLFETTSDAVQQMSG